MELPAHFRFGTATSATQVEGHCDASDWAAFARVPGRIRAGDTPAIACDQLHRYAEDAALQRALAMQVHRLGIEWARIEPRPGEIDPSALDHYRRVLGALRDAGITPMVTLHHFTLPIWLAERGGVTSREFPRRFVLFVRRVVEALGDLCAQWITINEPNVLLAFGYVLGVWPPAEHAPIEAVVGHQRLLDAHAGAYHAIHELQPAASVGVAHHLRVIEPEGRLIDRLIARAYRATFNDAFAHACCARKLQDFFGINYYGRDVVRFSGKASDGFLERPIPKGAETTDLGWEVYPEGLGKVLDVWGPRAGVPIWITENGIADADDDQRPSFIVRHLDVIAAAIARGIDVRGYLHWSLLDNFE